MQPRKFSCKCSFCVRTAKVFPLESFAAYIIVVQLQNVLFFDSYRM